MKCGVNTMNKNKELLRKIIRESIEEIQMEETYGQEEQKEVIVLKRIQSYAHWGAINFQKHPNEIKNIFDRIVKDIDELITAHNKGKETMSEEAPVGWEGTVKAMKKHKGIDNPWALSHWMKNKGYKSHKRQNEISITPNARIPARMQLKHYVSKPLRIPETKEWIVKWITDGKRDENKTYYTDDQKDAIDTYNQMVKAAQSMNASGK